MDSILILDKHMYFVYKNVNKTRTYIYEDKKKGNMTQNVYYSYEELEQ
jgi:hypothetical protein